MSLTSQIITAEFPDLEKVEQLNIEAFPEEERAPLSELLRYGDGLENFLISLPFMMRMNLSVLPFQSTMTKPFISAFLRLCLICAATVMVAKLLISWWIFTKGQWF